MFALTFNLKQRFVLEISILIILICMRKFQWKFFLYFLILSLIFRKNRQAAIMKERQNCFSYFFNQFSFFYSHSAININATLTTIWKPACLVEETLLSDPCRDAKKEKWYVNIFNLQHYFEINYTIFLLWKIIYCYGFQTFIILSI